MNLSQLLGAITNECEKIEVCESFPCIDLREGEAHHHIMHLTEVNKASIKYYNNWKPDGRQWTCTCKECTANSLVGTWSCPKLYDGTITITNDYADSFVSGRPNLHIDVCAKEGIKSLFFLPVIDNNSLTLIHFNHIKQISYILSFRSTMLL